MRLFDTHCHLNQEQFSNDLETVLDSSRIVGVTGFIIPGWDVESSQRAISIAENHPDCYAAIGIHPEEWQLADVNAVEEIAQLSSSPKVVAIGEIGLDFYRDPDHSAEQLSLLEKMIQIADESHKPILLHSRSSMDCLADFLRRRRSWKGILHAFEGSLDQANELIELGFKIGVGGPLTYKNSRTKHDIFSTIPLESIVLETDAPYLPPVPHRGERNTPENLPLIAQTLATLRETELEEMCYQLYENSYKIFL